MQAVALMREDRALRLVEKARPEPAAGEVLVRTLSVGIDGSDRRIVDGEIGEFPEGEAHLVLGHETVGVVEDPNGTDLERGDFVVPLVRRPTDDAGGSSDELDMAEPDTFVERGIFGAHGYMAEFFASRPEHLVVVPESVADYGFLVEPASLVEKSLEQAFAARSAFEWSPSTALVLGNGNLGLLALARLADRPEFERTYCLGRRDRPDPTVDFVESVGGTYVDSRATPPEAIPETHEPIDFAFEATGHPNHAVEVVSALASNGVATLQGIPGSAEAEIDLGEFHAGLVVENKALLGVVNSRASHFEAASEWLAETDTETLDGLITGVFAPEEAEAAFDDDETTTKTVVTFE
ncbi:alcohol dehydrogenase catalytic domain-containing protein [Haloarcula nitratireducens]|uniref:Alcohol dehydrogenase catalytic domain-containing protein n=1 Tax=Haloarcula nitratireducens TaxID=2487749 RepID=A0AAW4PE98_9EURY|nr:alcohol dehydrogenase catalytic domain-containing protein [Halomicroarcula nitratireducens]MBX0296168.1 alcohol dehydrogenase catalytic domain-containing protein [Halomicroarcula nitratireducens]